MNHFYKVFLLLCMMIMGNQLLSQLVKVEELQRESNILNRDFKYEESIKLISGFIDDKHSSHYDKAYAYILKSYVYKRLFDYDETLKCLDEALAEGEKSNKKEEVRMQVTAEKSFVYFDTQHYDEAKKYMKEIKNADYAYLKSADVAFVIMQEGQLYMFDKDYTDAEKSFDRAIALLQEFDPSNLPVVYGKKVELYNKMQLLEKREEAFRLGIESAEQNNILKYRIYMYEVLAGQHEYNKDYRNAYLLKKIVDSLSDIYNADQHNMKLKLYEKQMETQKKEYALQTSRKTRFFLIVLSATLLVLFVISLKLNRSNKQKRVLLENEYERMYNELQFLTSKLNEDESIETKLSQYNLSERHLEIIRLIRERKTNKEIANELFISENTVKYHLKTIYETLNIDNRNKLFQLLNH